MHVVKNMPSFSPKFRGFDFKQNFRRIFPRAKISAVADRAQAPDLGPVVDHQPVRPSRLKSVCGRLRCGEVSPRSAYMAAAIGVAYHHREMMNCLVLVVRITHRIALGAHTHRTEFRPLRFDGAVGQAGVGRCALARAVRPVAWCLR